MVQMALVEISAHLNRPFWSELVEIFSSRNKEAPKPSWKFFEVTKHIFGLCRPLYRIEICWNYAKERDFTEISAPQNRPFLGRVG